MNSVGLSSDVSPIFLADVLINFNRRVATIQGVTASALGPGDPVIFACFYAVVIRLEACALEALKSVAALIESAACLGK
jgi:hypothetical protein